MNILSSSRPLRAALQRLALACLLHLVAAGPTGCEARDEMLAAPLLKTLLATLDASTAARACMHPSPATALPRTLVVTACRLLSRCVLSHEVDPASAAAAAVKPLLATSLELLTRLPWRHAPPDVQEAVLALAAQLALSEAAHDALLATVPLQTALEASFARALLTIPPLKYACTSAVRDAPLDV